MVVWAPFLLGWIVAGVMPVDSVPVPITPALQRAARDHGFPPFLRDTVWVYRAIWQGETLQVVVDDVMGKHEPINFAMGVQGDTVRFVEVLAYREPYGGEIQNPRFLSHFQGKTETDAWRPGKDIPRIAGATISVRAITVGTRRGLWLIRYVEEGHDP